MGKKSVNGDVIVKVFKTSTKEGKRLFNGEMKIVEAIGSSGELKREAAKYLTRTLDVSPLAMPVSVFGFEGHMVVLEKAVMSLEDYCVSSHCNRAFLQLYLAQAAQCLCYLHHSLNVVHNDVKLSNFLLFKSDSGDAVKLADFDCCSEVGTPLVPVHSMHYTHPEKMKWIIAARYTNTYTDTSINTVTRIHTKTVANINTNTVTNTNTDTVTH